MHSLSVHKVDRKHNKSGSQSSFEDSEEVPAKLSRQSSIPKSVAGEVEIHMSQHQEMLLDSPDFSDAKPDSLDSPLQLKIQVKKRDSEPS